ncbi:septum formation family protein [Actinokineospora sp. NBRC 105648]|uniref:DUF4190 domain-containing protein n=1 Tax=Actinokineospora sp. NBRC 105648 TaxID=3032206 RepID=UPI0024A01EB4|nr:septum formation family protein [Actinokineospora sp. NBRC 105648]GLZ37237.1 hypothetical protein Acsp05_08620 [Actinokineospora sp. NBRC 105648]
MSGNVHNQATGGHNVLQVGGSIHSGVHLYQGHLDRRTTRMAIAALILGLCGFVPVLIPIAIVFAVIVLRQISKLGGDPGAGPTALGEVRQPGPDPSAAGPYPPSGDPGAVQAAAPIGEPPTTPVHDPAGTAQVTHPGAQAAPPQHGVPAHDPAAATQAAYSPPPQAAPHLPTTDPGITHAAYAPPTAPVTPHVPTIDPVSNSTWTIGHPAAAHATPALSSSTPALSSTAATGSAATSAGAGATTTGSAFAGHAATGSAAAAVKVGGAVAMSKALAVFMAVAGLVFSGVWGSAWAVAVVYLVDEANAADCEHPPSGQATACTLKPGDCFIRPSFSAPIPNVDLTSCGSRHDAQAIGAYTGGTGPWPGMTTLTADSETKCLPIAQRNVDVAALSETDQLGFLAPDQASWDAGYRNVICIVFTDTASWTSSVLAAGADLSIPTG